MRRTTVMLGDEVLERLRQAAHDQRRSLGALVREALEEKATRLAPPPRSVGHGAGGGRGPTAAQTGDLDIEPGSWRSS